MPAVHLLITGLVQGVFFRAQAKEEADKLGLTGFVKNLDDGGVEIFAEGPEEKLKQLEQWCWRGPPRAKVTNMTVAEEPEKAFSQFELWQ